MTVKRIKYTLYFCYAVICLTFVACTSNSSYYSSEEYDEAAVESILDEELAAPEPALDYEFEQTLLSKEGLEAFELRSFQKVADFVDYIGLISNPSIDPEFKSQAKSMLQSVFYNEKTIILLKTNKSGKEEKLKLMRFIDSLDDFPSTRLNLKLEDAKIIESLSPDAKNTYTGKIQYTLISTNTNGEKLIPEGRYTAHIDMVLIKVEKKFGDVNKQLWEVFLGDISIVPE